MTSSSSSLTSPVLDKATLLFVDDERRVLSSMRAMFRRDYHVFVADSGQRALQILDRERIDVIISDQRMPQMTGVELLCAVKEQDPSVMRILLTGYADLEAIEASINEGEVFRYLMKPCPPDDLKKAIAMAVEAVRNGGSGQPEDDRPAPQASADVSAEQAELIPFPARQRSGRPKATVHQLPRRKKPGKPAAQAGPRSERKADVLVLTADKALYQTVADSATGQRVMQVRSLDQALKALSERRVGVMITDITVDGTALESLTKTLKAEVPELVTIIASERSDAHTLIALINEGQIYRFLLKPVSKGQCKLWLSSATRKFEELAASETALARHRVNTADESVSSGLVRKVKDGLNRLQARLRL